MGERAAWGKMAAMCGHSTLLAGNADETSSLYIYLWAHLPAVGLIALADGSCQPCLTEVTRLFLSTTLSQSAAKMLQKIC